jgi:hypothetical protein
MPMKLCAVGHKRDFPRFREAAVPTQVLLDGRAINRVVAVDTATGVAWRSKQDEHGNTVIDRKREEIIIERITGSFRVSEGM